MITLQLVGTFGAITLSNRSYKSAVVIDASRATFAGTVTINNVKNLSIDGGKFNIVGAPNYTKAVVVRGGANILFDGAVVTGSAGGEGIVFDGTKGATLKNGTFSGLQVGAVFGSVNSGSATNNTVIGAVSDGIDIANSHSITASFNSCSGGSPGPGVHPDCIQLWSVTGHALQSDVVVTNNIATGPTQGFTSFDSMGGALRVQITYNTVDGSYPQGIACYGCIDSNISYNNLATLSNAAHLTNVNVIGGSRNSVIGNQIQPYSSRRSERFSEIETSDTESRYQPPDLTELVGTPSEGSTVNLVPEPSSWATLVVGFAVVGLTARRLRQAEVRT